VAFLTPIVNFIASMSDDNDFDDKLGAADEIRRSVGALAPESPHAHLVNPRFMAAVKQQQQIPPQQQQQPTPTPQQRATSVVAAEPADSFGSGFFAGICVLALTGLVVFGAYKLVKSATGGASVVPAA
jgi:hypothetical protein